MFSYELRAYYQIIGQRNSIRSQLYKNINIQDKCNQVGIEIMSPHYSAVRDGNQNTTPENYLPSDYVPQSFRVSPLGQLLSKIQNPSQGE